MSNNQQLTSSVARFQCPFVLAVVFGKEPVSAIDDWVDAWHDGVIRGCDLQTALGLSWPEYQRWAEDATYIHQIVVDHTHEK